MAYTTVNKSTDYFNTKLYTGNSSTQNITGLDFQPDWVSIKDRGATNSFMTFDAVRGATELINWNTTNAESTQTPTLTSFNSDGFSIGNNTALNTNGNNLVAWNWKANGQGSANTDGTINSTYTSANTTAGFSIVKYTATGSNGTVGHGLGVVPKMIIIKDLDDSGGSNWAVYHNSIGNTKFLELNNTAVQDTSSGLWNNTTPTSSVFSIGTNTRVNNSGNNFIAYCFAEKQGYSKIGSYIGTSSADGVFIYTGFKPSFFMARCIDNAESWYIFDNKRQGYNAENRDLYPDANYGEGSTDWLDILSNGIKFRYNSIGLNASSNNYIYYAVGQSLVGSNNVPCTAR